MTVKIGILGASPQRLCVQRSVYMQLPAVRLHFAVLHCVVVVMMVLVKTMVITMGVGCGGGGDGGGDDGLG